MSFRKMVKSIQKNKGILKILVVGRDNSGKSTILSRVARTDALVPPTFGYRILSIPYGDKTLNIFDMGGQESFQKYWSNHFEHTDLAIYVVDATSNLPNADLLNSIVNLRIPIAILINKIDLIDKNADFGAMERVYNVKNSNIRTFFTSAVTGEGISDGIDWLVSQSLQC